MRIITLGNRWRLGAECLCSYLAALLLTLCIFAVVASHSHHFGWELMGITAAYFPAGLFVWFTKTGGPWTTLGYIIYITLMALGIVFNRRIFLWIFVALLLVNISGCCNVLVDLENRGWAE